jgi:ribonuclease H / adenosylcobalamin/alpha-ribazole phosphatase
VSGALPFDATPGETVVMTIRHGLTVLNRDRRVGGRIDVPLVDIGRAQAEEAGRSFAGTPVDVVVTSPLRRAIETAELVTGRPSDTFEVDELCTERSFGEMEGIDPAEVPLRFPHVKYLRIDDVGYSLNPPGGESFDALHERAHRFVEGLLARHRGTHVAVFSHQNFMQQLHGVLRAQDPFHALEIDILNCELNAFRIDHEDALVEHAVVQLVPSAADHPSF